MMNYKDMEKIKNFYEKTPTKEWDDMLLEMAQIGNINKTTNRPLIKTCLK